MGDQFHQRYPNGTPLQGAAMHLSSQPSYNPGKPGLANGQPYPINQAAPRPLYGVRPQRSYPAAPQVNPNPSIPPSHMGGAPTVQPPAPGYLGSRPVNTQGISGPQYGPPANNFNNQVPTSSIRPATNYPGQYGGQQYAAQQQQQQLYQPNQVNQSNAQSGLVQGMERMSVAQTGFNKLWGFESVDLLQCRNILPPNKVEPPPIKLHHEASTVNCSQEIFCCTMNKIPETNSLLQKSRLPLGVLIHPFQDLKELPVVQSSSIVRCRTCRNYINPFVYFVDNKRWKCNLCFRVNELPEEFQFDPVSRTYGDPSRRPEIQSCTIEFIAPAEYMLRPPPPAVYLFLFDVSRAGCDSGYLAAVCDTLNDELDSLPGDARTQLGIILFDSYLHFLSIPDGATQARELVVTDIDDVFLPTPDSLLVNLQENKSAIRELLAELPARFAMSTDLGCALGPALQAGYKLMSPTGGRISLFQCSLPNKGPGSLSVREASGDGDKDAAKLNPQTDFYKRLALDCSTQQIAVDLFLLSSQYADLATVGGISQFSGGCVHQFPQFRGECIEASDKLIRSLRRYLSRKIGFEAVMRIRCSRGLNIHTFHGNFFVRSTDLLSLPNVNPDAGFGIQVSIEESLSELHSVCFQAALLYTSARGERRIRVHTLCLPVSSNLQEIMCAGNQQAIIGLLAKMAVERSLKSSLSDAREAFINASIDILSAYKLVDTSHGMGLTAPNNLSLIPLYILALLKSMAFRSAANTRLDDRMFSMLQMKNLPVKDLIQAIHPDLYQILNLEVDAEGKLIIPSRIGLTLQFFDSRGAYLLDTPDAIYILIGDQVVPSFLQEVLGVANKQALVEFTDLPKTDAPANELLRAFVNELQLQKPYPVIVRVLTEQRFYSNFFINDKSENALSYHELLTHIKAQIK